MRHPVYRLRKYDVKMYPDSIRQRFRDHKDTMVEQEEAIFGELVLIEEKAKVVCEAAGVPSIAIPGYLNFARQCYKYFKNFSQTTRLNEIQYSYNHWISRGLSGAVLASVAELCGVWIPVEEEIDSYGIENQDGYVALDTVYPSPEGISAVGQALPAYDKSYKLTKVKFYLSKFGSPIAVLRAGLWLSDGEKPTGAQLATSNPFNTEDLTGELQLIEFTFPADQQYVMEEGVAYAIVVYVESATLIDGENSCYVGYDLTEPTHAGISCGYDAGEWVSEPSVDTVFYLYGKPA